MTNVTLGAPPTRSSLQAARAPVAGRSALTGQRRRAAWMFLLPMLAVLALVAAWPLVQTIRFSLTDATLSHLDTAAFVGWRNYYEWADYGDGTGEAFGLLVDPVWWRAVWNTVRYTLISVSIETGLGLVFALVLNARFPGRALVRAAVLIPWAIPTVVSAQMWSWMFNDVFGVINHVLQLLGLIAKPIAWTASPETALMAVIIVDVWKTTPFMALLILAGLQMLPSDIYEAAKVDGIKPWRVFLHITLPLLKPALLVAIIFRALDALRIFDLIYVLTGNNKDTMSMSVYARQQLVDFQDVGYGSAAATMLFLIIATFTVIYLTVAGVAAEEK